MFPAIERRFGRSRYTSATLSSSSTATLCSPTSTETSSSRFAAGSGARRGGVRRRCVLLLRLERCAGFRSGRLAFFLAGSAAFVSAVAGSVFFLRPLPPRLPRRRFGLTCSPAVGAGVGATTGSGWAAPSAGASFWRFLRRKNCSKRNLLLVRARWRHPAPGGARAADTNEKAVP